VADDNDPRVRGLAGARVLLSEDNLINQEVAVRMLEAEGVHVDIANNGLEALERVRQRPYDAVLMDMQMPEMDGYEASRRIRADSALADLPIIAMTAHAMEGDRKQCLDAGMNDYVSKPIDPKHLFDVLGKWVSIVAEPIEGAAPDEASVQTPSMAETLSVPSFDLADAMNRLGGNERLYRKLLASMARNHSRDCEHIQDALKAGDLGAAQHIAHTLKGIAGNLSAKEVHQAAATMESVLTSMAKGAEGVDAEDCLAKLTQAMDRAVEIIPSMLPQPGESSQTQPAESVSTPELDKTQIADIARQVKEAAEDGDVEEITQAIELLPAGSEHRARFIAMADDFDHDGLVQCATELEQACTSRG
jgi:CheY-like chemotaxis protein